MKTLGYRYIAMFVKIKVYHVEMLTEVLIQVYTTRGYALFNNTKLHATLLMCIIIGGIASP